MPAERKLAAFKKKTIKLGNSTLVLRPATKKDAKALNEIINEPGVNEFVLVERPVSLASTRKALAAHKKGLWIASELDGMVVGSVALRPGVGRHDVVCQFGIAFSKSVHGKGVAKAALDGCFEWMRQNKFDNCTEGVLENNARARKFYKKMGFAEVGYTPRQVRCGNKIVGVYVIQKMLR